MKVRLSAIGVLWLSFSGSLVLFAQELPATSQGTVNIALANANGIVLLTDSVQTVKGNGRTQYKTAPKLFRLDDKTVCSIAGFAAETGWIPPLLNTDVAGIVSDFTDQLSQKPVPQLDAKLQALGYLVGFYIDLIANRREIAVGTGTPADTYKFEVIVAGYDADGTPKIEKLTITAEIQKTKDGHSYWSTTRSPDAPQVHRKLVHLLGGIKEVSNNVLNNPQAYDSDAVRRYIAAKKHDNGESLTLDEMTALASYMASQTAKLTPSVGGPDQIAILANGNITKFEQPAFPHPPRPLHFALMVGLKLTTAVSFALPADVHFIWIQSKFIAMRFPGLQLDGNFFYGCEVRDSVVSYAGGLTDFGTTNTVDNSWLTWGSAALPEGDRISKRFKWRDDPPNPPPLPVTIGPA